MIGDWWIRAILVVVLVPESWWCRAHDSYRLLVGRRNPRSLRNAWLSRREDDYFESSILILDHHGITQYPYFLDFDFNDIARFEIFRWMHVVTYTARRAG